MSNAEAVIDDAPCEKPIPGMTRGASPTLSADSTCPNTVSGGGRGWVRQMLSIAMRHSDMLVRGPSFQRDTILILTVATFMAKIPAAVAVADKTSATAA